MSIRITMACGHTMTTDGSQSPHCHACGESRVAHVKAPAPRFRGVVLGPCAEYEELPAKRVTLKETR